MSSLFHLLRLTRDPAHPGAELVRLAAHGDVQWNRPIFKAPSLPTPQQSGSELPFSVHFRPKDSGKR